MEYNKSNYKKRDYKWWEWGGYEDVEDDYGVDGGYYDSPVVAKPSYTTWFKPKYDMSVNLESRVIQLIKTITGKSLSLRQAHGWGNDEKFFYYNPKDLENATDDEVLGRILHQLAKELFVDQKEVGKLNEAEPEYRHLLNTLEDNRADRQLQDLYNGCKYYAEEMWESRKWSDNPINFYEKQKTIEEFVEYNWGGDLALQSRILSDWKRKGGTYEGVKEIFDEYNSSIKAKQVDAWEFCFNINAFQNGETQFDFVKDKVADKFTEALPFIDKYLKAETFAEALEVYPEIKKRYPKPDEEEQEQMDGAMGGTQGLSGEEMAHQQAQAEAEARRGEADENDASTILASHGEEGVFDEQKDLADYKLNLAKHQGVINTLHALINSILKDNAIKRYNRPFKRGKLDAKRMYKYISTDNLRIFKRPRVVSEKNYLMTIVVDMSGSMYGSRAQYAKEGTIVLAETLERLGFPYEIIGYNGNTYNFKKFDEPLVREHIPTIGKANGDNNEVKVIKVMDKHLSAYDPTVKYKKSVFFITDGGSANAYATKKAVTELEAKHNTVVYGIGIGDMNEEELDENYNTFLKVDNVSQLPKELVNLMRGQFRRTG